MSSSDNLAALESGDPSNDSDAFRRALGHFSTGVTVITAEADGRRVGVTANSFSSVSLDPPLVLWSIKKTSSSWPVFEAAQSFAINVLSTEQTQLAAQFARSGTDKFAGVEWRSGATGAPLLADVTAQFDCLRRVEHDGGDHLIVVGEVVHFARFDRRPLVFTQGRFSAAIDNPGTAQSDLVAGTHPRPTMLTLLRRAFLQRASEFREEAREAGFNMDESRLTYHLEVSPGLTVEALARVALLDPAAAADSLSSLAARGWIAAGPDGRLELTPDGKKHTERLREVAWAAEADKLKGFSDAEVATALKVLASFGGRLDNIPVRGDEI